VVNQPKYVKVALITVTMLSLVSVTAAYGQGQAELIIVQHEDLSITLKTLNGTELKGYANINALAGPNGLADIVQQMENWN
jgi:hypothetical protein